MFSLSRIPLRCSLFQFQKNPLIRQRMETLKTILSNITGGREHEQSPSGGGASNEQIRHQLCRIDELQNGQMKEFEIKTSLVNTSVLLIKQNNQFHAYSSKCCHYKLPLAKGKYERL